MKQKALQIFLAGVNKGKAAFLMVKGVNDLDKIDVAI